jgi:single-strand DNA-binding protein
MNSGTLVGRLVRDPESITTKNGNSAVYPVVAYDNRKRNGESSTTFRECAAFGKTAEMICQYFSKGSPVLFIGRIEDEEYDYEKNGERKQGKKAKFYIDSFSFLPSASAKDNGNANGAPPF